MVCGTTSNYWNWINPFYMLLSNIYMTKPNKRANVIMLYRIVNHLVAISPEPYITSIPRGVALTTRGHDTRFRLPYSRIHSHQQSFFSNRNPYMERITNCCRNCLHLGRIQGQLPDNCHILDMPVLIVYTTPMAFNICK